MKILSSTIFNLIKNYDFNPITSLGLRGGGELTFYEQNVFTEQLIFLAVGQKKNIFYCTIFEKITKLLKFFIIYEIFLK